jgi:hypothetical protein
VNAPARLGAFAVVLAAAFGGGVAVGAAVGPIDQPAPEPHPTHQQEPAASDPPPPSTTAEGHDGSHTSTTDGER